MLAVVALKLGRLFIKGIVRHWNWRKSPEAVKRHIKFFKMREYELLFGITKKVCKLKLVRFVDSLVISSWKIHGRLSLIILDPPPTFLSISSRKLSTRCIIYSLFELMSKSLCIFFYSLINWREIVWWNVIIWPPAKLKMITFQCLITMDYCIVKSFLVF